MTEKQFKIEYEEALKRSVGKYKMSVEEEREYLEKLEILNDKIIYPYHHTFHQKFSSTF